MSMDDAYYDYSLRRSITELEVAIAKLRSSLKHGETLDAQGIVENTSNVEAIMRALSVMAGGAE